jgi:DNA repair exonuclease SbcCD ATPase subunit
VTTTNPTSATLTARRDSLLAEAAKLLQRRAELQTAVDKATSRAMDALGAGDDKVRTAAEAVHTKHAGELATVNMQLGRIREAVRSLDEEIPEAVRAEAGASTPALREALRQQEAIVMECERRVLAARDELGRRARVLYQAGLQASGASARLHVRRSTTYESDEHSPTTFTKTESMSVDRAWAEVAAGRVTFEDPTRQALAILGGNHA